MSASALWLTSPSRHVYWSNYNTAAIGRANVDRTEVNQSFIGTNFNPEGMAVDGNHIYWSRPGLEHDRPGERGRDGCEPELYQRRLQPGRGSSRRHPHLLGQLQRRLDRACERGRDGCEPELHQHQLQPTRGGDRRQPHLLGQLPQRHDRTGEPGRERCERRSFISTASSVTGVAVDSGHIYWSNWAGNTIGRANLDGTGVNQSFISGASTPVGVAVDSGHLYCSDITTRAPSGMRTWTGRG